MDIHIAVDGHHDLSGQIYRQLRAGILEGRLAGGTRLPSTRDLATQLGVSRKTTLDVFERLLSEGYLSARAGSGTFVADGLERLPIERSAQARAAESSRERAKARPKPLPRAPSRCGKQMPESLPLPRPSVPSPQDFVGGATDKALFPFDVWRRCVNHALRAQARGPGTYRDAAGEQELRLAISRYLAFNRAVSSNWEDVIVTQGAQHALDLMARITLAAGRSRRHRRPRLSARAGVFHGHRCARRAGAGGPRRADRRQAAGQGAARLRDAVASVSARHADEPRASRRTCSNGRRNAAR